MMNNMKEILDEMINYQNKQGMIQCVLEISKKNIPLLDVKISSLSDVNDTVPKNNVTYNLKGSTSDHTILSFLSSVMLGPKTEFAKLKINTNFLYNSANKTILYGNLTSCMQSKSVIRLHMTLVDARLEN